MSETVLQHKNFDLIASDLLNFFQQKDDASEEIDLALNLMKKIVLEFSNNELDGIEPYLEIILDNYELIKEEFSRLKPEHREGFYSLFKKINNSKDKDSHLLFEDLTSIIKNKNILKIMTRSMKKEILSGIVDTIIKSVTYSLEANLGEGEFMQNFVTDKKFSVVPIQNMLQKIYTEQGSFDYVYGILKTLSSRHNGVTGTRLGLEELFDKNDEKLSLFLVDLFARFKEQ